MQLSPQTIKEKCIKANTLKGPLISPFREAYRHEASGLSGGLSCAGYDVHMTDELLGLDAFKQKPRKIGDDVWVLPPRTGCLAVTKEHFNLRANLAMHYYNKSTLARKFLNACATLGEPGWSGHLTLELYNQTDQNFMFYNEQPIGQVIFINLDQRSDNTYSGKYQGQGAVPVPAR